MFAALFRRLALSPLIVAGLTFGGASALMAQTSWAPQEGIENLPRGIDVQQRTATLGWVFHPIANSTEIIGFFAELDSADAFGANVKLMYFTHDNSDNWTSYGWAESDLDGAIAWVCSQHGTGALARDVDYSDYTTTKAAVAPAEMKGGIFVGDPNAAIFDEMNPDARSTLVAWLVDSGYAASPKLAEVLITEYEGGPKVLNELMGYLSNQAEYTLFPLKTTYAATSALAWPCGCTSAKTKTTLPTPGVPALDPDVDPNPKPVGAACQWKYRRAIGTETVTSIGKTFWTCSVCTSSTTTTIYEYTTVEEVRTGIGCPATPAGGIPATNPWTLH